MDVIMKSEEKSFSKAFEGKFWLYLEENGIFLDLKAQLRQKVINVLKSIEPGKQSNTDQNLKRNISPKFKAINLLIADYLLHQGYQYALSMFSSEDPTLSCITERTILIKPQSGSNPPITIFKFNDTDIVDILEALGFSSEAKIFKEVNDCYNNPGSEDSLLLCLLKYLSKNFIMKNEKDKAENMKNDFTKNKNNKSTQTSTSNNLNPVADRVVQLAYGEMQKAFNNELEIVRNSEKKKYEEIIEARELLFKSQVEEIQAQLEKEIVNLKKKYAKKLKFEQEEMMKREYLKEKEIEKGLQDDLRREKEKMIQQFRTMEKNTNGQTILSTDIQQSVIEVALKAVQHQSRRLRRKEEVLNARMTQVIEINNKEMANFSCQFPENIDSCQSDIKGTQSIASLSSKSKCSIGCQTNFVNSNDKRLKKSIECQVDCISNSKKSVGNQCHLMTNHNEFEKYEVREQFQLDENKFNGIHINDSKNRESINEYKNMRYENTYLKAFNNKQRQHIEELLNKQTAMCKEIKDAKNEITNLTKQLTILKCTFKPKLENNSRHEKSRYCKRSHKLTRSNSMENCRLFNESDYDIAAIKENIRQLEYEGEAFVRSYKEFKQRQSENEGPSKKSPMLQTILGDSLYKSRSEIFDKYPISKINQIPGKSNITHTHDYLNRSYFHKFESAAHSKKSYGGQTVEDIFHNYVDTSLKYSKYSEDDPKMFADAVCKKNVSKHIEDVPCYTKQHFEESHIILPIAKYEDVMLKTSRSDIINSEIKHASLEFRRNNLLRRWSLPSSLYRRSPLTLKDRNQSFITEHNKINSISEVSQKSKFNKKLRPTPMTTEIDSYECEIRKNEPFRRAIEECSTRNSPKNKASNSSILCLKRFKLNTRDSENIIYKNFQDTIIKSILNNQQTLNPDDSLNVENMPIKPSICFDSKSIITGSTDKASKLSLSDISTSEEKKALIECCDNPLNDNATDVKKYRENDIQIENIMKDTPNTDCFVNKCEKDNENEIINVHDNSNNHSAEPNEKSEDTAIPSSLELSIYSHISRGNVSEGTDTFWN